MQKNILLFILLTILLPGIYGCSCSQRPTDEPELTPGLYIGDVTISELNEGESQATINVKLAGIGSKTVVVNYEIFESESEDAKATIGDVEGADVRSAKSSLTFNGNTGDTLSIPLTIVNDIFYELDEVFVVRLTAASGANIIEGEAIVTLKNDDPKPVASISLTDPNGNLVLNEAAPERIGLTLSLNAVSGVDASMNIMRSAESAADVSNYGKIAAYRIDYFIYLNEEKLPADANVVIPAGQQELEIALEVIDDGIRENSEAFTISLVEAANVSMANNEGLAFTITDNDSSETVVRSKLNDTGVLDAQGSTPVQVTLQLDNNFGRDKSYVSNHVVTIKSKSGGGRAGFDFTKLSTYNTPALEGEPWDCVRDNTTGLTWEEKINGEVSLRGAGIRFYWHDPDFETNGGFSGVRGSYECGATAGKSCSTAYYVADMNAQKLCGVSGWRLPTIEELRSIVDYGATSYIYSNAIHYDPEYFAGDQIGTSFTWSSTTYASSPEYVLTIRFSDVGFVEEPRLKTKAALNGIRLVNDGPVNNDQ